MGRKYLYLILMFLFTITSLTSAYSHSGRTNADGCHTNRSTGNYHCHNPKVYTPKSIKRAASLKRVVDSPRQYCCKICRKGKACGDSCIATVKTCHKGAGCACDN